MSYPNFVTINKRNGNELTDHNLREALRQWVEICFLQLKQNSEKNYRLMNKNLKDEGREFSQEILK